MSATTRYSFLFLQAFSQIPPQKPLGHVIRVIQRSVRFMPTAGALY